jgi:hypothetical protein
MNPTSLLPLIVDQHAGELAPEVNELLEAHLAQNAVARAEAERIRATLALTEQTILLHPELAQVAPADSRVVPASPMPRRVAPVWLARAASVMLIASLAGSGGFFLGRKNAPAVAAAAPPAEDAGRPPRKDSPWARYEFAPGGNGGGMQIVRVNSRNATKGQLQ